MPLVLDIDTMWFPPRQLSPVWGNFVDSGRGDQPCMFQGRLAAHMRMAGCGCFTKKKRTFNNLWKKQSLKDLSDLSTTFGINNDQNPWSPKTVPPTWHLWCLGKMVSPPAWRKIHKVGPSKIRRKEHDIEQDSMESAGKKNILNILNQFKSHLVYKSYRKSIVSPTFQPSPLPRKGPLLTQVTQPAAPACGGSK